MEPFAVLTLIASGVFGTGGAAAFYKARKDSQAVVAKANADVEAAVTTATVEAQKAATADWDALNKHWAAELERRDKQMTEERQSWQKQISDAQVANAKNFQALDSEVVRLRHRQEEDALHIDDLEEHIWLQKPPPPPRRKRLPFPGAAASALPQTEPPATEPGA
ncbi:hypothetical protein ACMX2H_17460 [Arthrobacter sulfonylureivorans]|uniref:hypothetical protein n=1 Tax=Arthrobacter sulfonylureivorans TaxID=2486855 RepID=UPI0039E5242B